MRDEMLHLRPKFRRFSVLAILLIASLSLTSCASRQGTGLLVGGGGGALIGQAIGGNTKSTLLGAGIGAAVGLLTASASESHHHHEVEVRRHRVEKSPRPPINLSDSRWEAVYHRGEFEGAESLILEFRGDDTLVIRANFGGGETRRYERHFQQSGSTLAISDERGVGLAKIRYRREILEIRGENFRARLREI